MGYKISLKRTIIVIPQPDERDMERPWPGLDQILKDMDIPEEWESVKTLTWDEFTKKFGKIKTEVTKSGGYTTYTPEWIYESPDGKIVYRRKDGSDKRQLLYKHPHSGPPYTMFSMQGEEEWVDEETLATNVYGASELAPGQLMSVKLPPAMTGEAAGSLSRSR